jgi:hypothetical protein
MKWKRRLRIAGIVIVGLLAVSFALPRLFAAETDRRSRIHTEKDLKYVFDEWKTATITPVDFTQGFGGAAVSSIVTFPSPHEFKVEVRRCTDYACYRSNKRLGWFRMSGYGSCGGRFKFDQPYELGGLGDTGDKYRAGGFIRSLEKTIYCVHSATW